MRFSLSICFFFFVTSYCFAQQGYEMSFKINGLKDTTAYLGYTINESTYIKDTAQVNNKGQFSFEGKQALRQGIYFLVMNKTKLFEFVVGGDQRYSMSTSTSDYVTNMVVVGDIDNKLFFENMSFRYDMHKVADPLAKILKDSVSSEEHKKNTRAKIVMINEKVNAYQEELLNKYPLTLTARILKAYKQVSIPEAPKKADGSADSTFQLRWYREHFFDHFDLADEALLYMPKSIYKEKMYEYLDRLFLQQADSLGKAIDVIVSKAKKNQETYKYAVWLCALKYQNPEIMGLDEIYVNLFDKYFATGEMNFWANEKLVKNLKEETDRIRRSLVGRTGANLIMLDSDLKPKSLYDIKNKYTILYIFNPDCYKCKEETPKLVDFYNKKIFDIEVYAVSSDTSMTKMKAYIKDMGMNWITVNGPRTYTGSYQNLYDANMTPTLYILDDKKKIIAKKLPVENLQEFLTQYEKIEKINGTHKF